MANREFTADVNRQHPSEDPRDLGDPLDRDPRQHIREIVATILMMIGMGIIVGFMVCAALFASG
jgi:hypothetical protein